MRRLNNLLYFMAGVLAVVLVGIIAITVRTKVLGTGTSKDSDIVGTEAASTYFPGEEETTVKEKWQEGTIEYNGGYYEYNSKLKTYLLMGIDKDGVVETASDYTKGGQSDAIFLMVVNDEAKKLSVISVNRNTITSISLCDEEGKDLGKLDAQLCVQHAFGDGKRLSCTRTVDAVSALYDNIPINGYVSINMGAVPNMNDAIGGVTLEVMDDLNYPSSNVSLRKGETVTLQGREAYCYLRGRDINDFDSATERLRRQEQYIVAYMNKLKSMAAADPSVVTGLYNSISDYIVSDMDFVSLANMILDYDFSSDNLYTLPGETTIGDDDYEEYIVDEDAKEAQEISIFYKQVVR